MFGQKDGQQARIIKRMVRDLNFPIRIVISPIIREPDGLARSSRNKYLSEEEHRNALSLSRGLAKLNRSGGFGNAGADYGNRRFDDVPGRGLFRQNAPH